MSALIRVTQGIAAQHSRVGFARAFAQFGEVVHAHKPPYSGIPGEDFVNIRFATQDGADRAYAALKAGTVVVDGLPVGMGPVPNSSSGGGGGGGKGDDRGGGGSRSLAIDDRRGGGGGGGGYGGGYSYGGPGSREKGAGGSRDFDNRAKQHDDHGYRGRGGKGGRGRSPSQPRAMFPSHNTPKSPSPRRMAREAGLKPRNDRSRSRRGPGDRIRRFVENPAMPEQVRMYRQERTPSPDPPGPEKILTMVRNPFFKDSWIAA